MADGEARRIHETRPLAERLADEARVDALARDLEQWLGDKDRFDLPRVDEPAPIELRREVIAEKVKPGKPPRQTVLVKGFKDGEQVGEVALYLGPCDGEVPAVEVKPAHEGKGYAVFLMREAVNIADAACVRLRLTPFPFRQHAEAEIGAAEWERRERVLEKFYATFNFAYTAKDDTWAGAYAGRKDWMLRRPVCDDADRAAQAARCALDGEW